MNKARRVPRRAMCKCENVGNVQMWKYVAVENCFVPLALAQIYAAPVYPCLHLHIYTFPTFAHCEALCATRILLRLTLLQFHPQTTMRHVRLRPCHRE